MKCIYNTSQMSMLSLTLHTLSLTGLVASLCLTLSEKSSCIMATTRDDSRLKLK